MRTMWMLWCCTVLLCATVSVAAPVWAQDGEPAAAATSSPGDGHNGYPAAEISRPLALPRMMLEARGGLVFVRTPNANIISLFAGAGFGVVDGLEVGIGGLNGTRVGRAGQVAAGASGLGLTLALSPDVDIGDMPVYGMYDLSDMVGVDNLDLAARLTLNLPLDTNFQIIVDAPLRLRVADAFAVIGTVVMGAQLASNQNAFLIGAEAGGLFQATDTVAILATLGVIGALGDASTALIPLAFRGEFMVKDPIDVYVEFSFPELNNLGGDVFMIMGGFAYRVGF